jgi:predicted DNA-binding transcriptional regulator YafY
MDRLRRIYQLHQILTAHRLPVPLCTIQEKLECSRASVNRIIREMRLFFDAPIEYDRQGNGYHYAQTGSHPYELPGLWFSGRELHALMSAQQLLSSVQPGLLDNMLAPLRDKIGKILALEHLGQTEISQRVRILRIAGRTAADGDFQTVADAVLRRKCLAIRYFGRGSNSESSREISPQRLIHYRDNWYLDAWCHQRNALRSFAVENIKAAHILDQAAIELADAELDAHFAAGYGIFAGKPQHTAILRFTPERARWVADEQWHPEQQGRFLEGGSYELRIPYSDPRELVMDILKYGPDVEVAEPEALRVEVVGRLKSALEGYGGG